ncbi:response regulator [Pseudobacteriovorax antillogorgiicola]|uniref:Tetratricopeptide repeat-containing protein n=1 Tax=Pseudobacteriovorax antillogorgiicola TaxID=1513793 RepID=A0A1Y6CFJ2_9BACT|nr:response regulator [Pseudobacteriovorax antillogorgiicola]TCS49059.1 tetratricopeptide repeat protein [Pseudobacteriovorax antillogorgiicola]SMF52383.1 Tetratricopeptide repeat-containing protein [Pseudobacteriovorax antillogorgiicola]
MSNDYSNTKVLVVTSVRNHAKAILVGLKNLGLQKVSIRESGLEALSILASESWDLVICDQEMKQINGWLFIKEFKLSEKVPNIPAILLGRNDAPVEEEVLKRFGLIKYLKLPVRPSELDFLIHSTLSLANTSGTIENKYTQAKDSLIQHNSEEAVELYSELQTLTKGSLRSNVGLAQAYIQNQEDDRAHEVLETIANSGENTPASMMLSARMSLKRGNKDAGVKVIETLLKAHGNEFYYSRCVGLLNQHNFYDESKTIALAGRELGFDAAEFYSAISRALVGEGAYDRALQEIKEAEEKFGESAEQFNLKGVCHRKTSNLDEAIEAYEHALRLNPENHKVYFNIAICFIELGQLSEAARQLENCVRLRPDFERARDKLAEVKGRLAS